ncbi:MAG: hypothetical protein EXS37_07485 [Opitutus sp.]|nr:hypothetical protein [Opitutus sp.]
MAWRIEEYVVRGEIDNRTRGRVRVRIWLVGLETPVELDLAGNAWRDLAGRRLEFVNPEPKPGDLHGIAVRQRGVIGDCTASRKVKVPEIPLDQIEEYYESGKTFPWHWGNSLYLEWFSASNGRVVIESAIFQLTVAADVTWEMSAAGEERQRRENSEAMKAFMQQLAESADDAPAMWDEAEPTTEAEAEKMQADSDRLSDRIQARLAREGPEADYEKILEEELERRAHERGDKPLTPEEEAERAGWIEEMNRAAEEAVKNPDPELKAELEIKHPLAERAFELSVRLMREPEERDWIPADANAEHPVVEVTNSVMSASAKFAGALNGNFWPPDVNFCAHTVVRLKRARDYLEDALRAADACAEQNLVDAVWLATVRAEIEDFASECDALIAELRAKLDRGFD